MNSIFECNFLENANSESLATFNPLRNKIAPTTSRHTMPKKTPLSDVQAKVNQKKFFFN
jgi:hypothetical protein